MQWPGNAAAESGSAYSEKFIGAAQFARGRQLSITIERRVVGHYPSKRFLGYYTIRFACQKQTQNRRRFLFGLFSNHILSVNSQRNQNGPG